jgi:hypothetical protein
MGAFKRILAKLAGHTAKAKAIVEGNVGVLASLAGDHAEIETLMEGISATGDAADPKAIETRRRLFRKLRLALGVHQRAETQEFYKHLDNLRGEHARMVSCAKEHDEIESRMAHLQSLPLNDASWMGHFAELVANVQCHHDSEEHEVFSEARELLSASQLEEMDAAFRAARESVAALIDGRPPGTRIPRTPSRRLAPRVA